MEDEVELKQNLAAANPSPGASRAGSRLGPWSFWSAIAVCLVVGAVVVERLTRPADEPSQDGPAQVAGPDASGLPPIDSAESISADSTPEQAIAMGQRLADRLVEAFPDNPQALTLGGRIQYTFTNSAKAMQWWEKCLQIDPQFAEARCALGAAAWERGDFQKAVEFLRSGTAGNARLLSENVFYLADALMNLGKASQAAAMLEDASKKSTLSPAGSYVLGQAYMKAKEYEKAREQFAAALAADPGFANAHYGMAMTLARLGKEGEAAKHRAEFAKLKKSDLAGRDRADGAGHSKEKADPAETRRLVSGYCLGAGKIYAVHNRLDEAERLWRVAVILNPQNPEPRAILEVLYREQGRNEEATRIRRGDAAPPAPTTK
jgi:tetratricopeptide (TPR) repeat protein